MNKKSFFITAVLVFVFASAVFGQPWDGNGVEGDPYQIWDANDMQAIGADANYWNAHFLLMADIDLSGYMGTSFNIIGIDYYNPFTGIFDGNGHTISNFTCDSNGTNYIGVFGHINDLNAEVKDLGLITPDVNAGNGGYVGALVGCLRQGRISGCYAEGGSISGGYYTGGLVGDSSISGVISNSYSAASVTGNSYVGGLIGWGGAISYCYSTGSVLGTTNVGGLVGYGTRVALESYWDIETSGVDYSATGTGFWQAAGADVATKENGKSTMATIIRIWPGKARPEWS